MIIYKATNKITNEHYIGKTNESLNKRISAHKYNAFVRRRKNKFHSAIFEFGMNNFEFSVLYEGRNLINKEKEYIIKYNSINYGYNSQIRRDK